MINMIKSFYYLLERRVLFVGIKNINLALHGYKWYVKNMFPSFIGAVMLSENVMLFKVLNSTILKRYYIKHQKIIPIVLHRYAYF